MSDGRHSGAGPGGGGGRGRTIEQARVIHRLCGAELAASERIVALSAGATGVVKQLETITGNYIIYIDIELHHSENLGGTVSADPTRLPLEDGSVDFALLDHLYEHVSDQAGLFHEMDRVLSPGGGAFLTAANRLTVVEPHYRLPFLSWLPRPLADAYLRLTDTGQSYGDIRLRTRRGLERRIRAAGLRLEDRTLRAMERPAGRREPEWGWLWRAIGKLPDVLLEPVLRHLSPRWFLLVRKPRDRTREQRPGRGGILRTRRRSTGRSRGRRRRRR